MNASSEEFGSKEVTTRLWNLFNGQLLLLAEAKDVVRKDGRLDVSIHALIYSVLCTGESLSYLANRTSFRDCYILGRAVFETLLNAAFIISEDQSAAKLAHKHALQKSYRNLKRELKVGKRKIVLTYKPYIKPDKNIREALNDFTSKKGREITSWTEESLASSVVSQKYLYCFCHSCGSRNQSREAKAGYRIKCGMTP